MKKDTQQKIDELLSGLINSNLVPEQIALNMQNFLKYKNTKYGDGVVNPKSYFNKPSPSGACLARLNDKAGRIETSKILNKNDVVDLAGYVILFCIIKNWKINESLNRRLDNICNKISKEPDSVYCLNRLLLFNITECKLSFFKKDAYISLLVLLFLIMELLGWSDFKEFYD
jgi:hypothetical protein